MTTLHTGYQPNTYEDLDAKLITGVETNGDALVVGSYIVDKYKELQSLKDMTIATHPLVSTPHTILSEWLLDNRIDLKTGVDIKITRVDKKRLR